MHREPSTYRPEKTTAPATSVPAESPSLDRPQRIGRKTMVALVLLFVVLGHAWSIPSGLYLDDHAHFEHLRHDDWSFRAAVEASRLGIVGQVIDLWGRREAGLLFFRPIAFWTMKAEYTLAAWHPAVMHLFSLGWHTACALLTGALAMRCFGRRSWATVAACLQAIHPNHVATVYWIACQTELLTTTLLLVGILAYAHHAGWPQRMFLATTKLPRPTPETTRRAVTPAAAIAVLCYALALGCRENAVLFPVVCLAGDLLCGTAHTRRIRMEHLAMGGVLIGYLALRWFALGGFPLPAKPYLMPITDPAFPRFVLDKISIYLTGLFLYVPVVPIGGRTFWEAHPAWLYGGLAAILLAVLAIWRLGYRGRPALLWPLVWIACFLAPVMPVFASSHHLYLPGVGMALLTTAGLAALRGILPLPHRRLPRVLRATSTALIATHAIILPAYTWSLGFAYTRGTLVEDMLIRDVITRGRPLHNGDHLFFVNMPLLAYYAVPAIKERLGLTELYGHALTFAPDLVHMSAPGTVEQLDRYRLRVRAPENQRYFEGITGKTLLDVMGLTGRIQPGRPIEADLFTVLPTHLDAEGVEELVFTFKRPLDTPGYHFYFGSPHFMAYPIGLAPRAIQRACDRPCQPATRPMQSPSGLKKEPQQ